MADPNPQWTQKQGIAYETTCEAMMHYIGMVVSEIYAEEATETPRAGIVAALNQRILDVKDERDALRVTDAEKVAETRDKYAALLKTAMPTCRLEALMLVGAQHMATDGEARREVAKRLS
jgi:hypothetical protein